MVKIAFTGIVSFAEQDLYELLFHSADALIKDEGQVEFWFNKPRSDFDKICLEIVINLIRQHSEKDIKVVRVVDGEDYARNNWDVNDSMHDGIPPCLPMRIEYAPKYELPEDSRSRFVQRFQKIDRWMHSQCDYLFAYYYENLPNSANTFIKTANRRPNVTVIPVSFADTQKRIAALIDRLEGREKEIILALNAGRTAASIGKELGISGNRVKQIAQRGVRTIKWQLRCEQSKKTLTS